MHATGLLWITSARFSGIRYNWCMDSSRTGRGGEEEPISTPPLLTGYQCERLLGRGGSANVWLIRNDSGEFFALKVLGPARADPLRSDAVSGEERFLARFPHEHLVTLHEVIHTDQGMGLRMEYAAGGSLLNLVSVRGPLPPGEVVTVLTPLAQVLAFLHGLGAVHGDVAPGNILFTEVGKPLLADFGVGRLLGEARHRAGGTPGFQETPQDPDGLNTEADIYALAAVGWFALTGRVPGPAIQRPPLSLLVPEAPEDLMDLINWGLEGEPGERPTASEFARAVQRTAQAEPLDLVAAVHPDVLPHLRTRRSTTGSANPPTGRRRSAGKHRPAKRRPGDHQSGEHQPSDRRPATYRTRRPGRLVGLAVTALSMIVLSVCGALFAGTLLGIGGEAPGALDGSGPSSTPPGQGETAATAEIQPSQETTRSTAAAPTAAVASTALADADPLTVLPLLSRLREQAFETADAELLKLVNVPSSPAMAADEGAVLELRDRGHTLSGLTIELTDLTPVELSSGAAVATDSAGPGGHVVAVAATATTSGFDEVTPSGDVHRTETSPVTQQLVFVLQRGPDHWRISAVHEP